MFVTMTPLLERHNGLTLIGIIAMICYICLCGTNGQNTEVDYCEMIGCNNSFTGCYDTRVSINDTNGSINDTNGSLNDTNGSINDTNGSINDTNGSIGDTGCNCNDGFWGVFCENDMLEELYNVSLDTNLNMSAVTNVSHLTVLALADHVRHGYYLLPSSVNLVSKIQQNLVRQVKVIMDKETNLSVFKNDVLNMSDQIFNSTPSLLSGIYRLTEQHAKNIVISTEENILEMIKMLLSQVNVDQVVHTGNIPYTMFSLAYTKAKGPNLPFSYKTKFGSFDLPFWETFHDQIRYETVSVILLTYETSPYFFASNADDISSGLVKTIVTDRKGNDLNVEDPDDPIALDASAKRAVDPVSGWSTLDPIQSQEGAAFLAVAAFNFTVNAVIVDLKLATMKLCTTYAAYGRSTPTVDEYDFKVETMGKSRLKSVFPEDFRASYSDQVLQLALNYKGEESIAKPFLMTVICEDDSLIGNGR
ncbi:uncharacterized protein LOC110445451 [Mizuhopecten yessoensis]|uniref:uncharacterized protein LOC110445451 n=1 Tax=Mizuhopecten yessoensis TaxID=6573 RepID=UPI000B458401|nr:uncharacterized protein LOC110445451 [Mizuhopecten yessoensis]